jgi:succinate dehydrogenase / fumarate reductase iron-sulfur subunit
MVLKVRRFDPANGRVRYEHFDVKSRPGMTVLGALFYVQERIDDSLSFRYSCRGAVCGTCAVLVNRVPRLACRTQLDAVMQGADNRELKPDPTLGKPEPFNPRHEILVEPLSHFHVLKDLVVDFRKFFRFYEAVEPTFRAPQGLPERELRLEPAAAEELEAYTNCVLCGACYAACPVCGRNPDFSGPAALAKLYRFAIDPREAQNDLRLLQANQPNGWWACEFFANCKLVCPKAVPPNLVIGAARRKLTESGKGLQVEPTVEEAASTALVKSAPLPVVPETAPATPAQEPKPNDEVEPTTASPSRQDESSNQVQGSSDESQTAHEDADSRPKTEPEASDVPAV